ncbi:hypothetical protein ACN6LC_006678 [Streptomyces violaceoruber]|uniref:Secreted protein n=1 Tax=Streptomyces violaceolatus TaxID=67378 RepID=A0ABN3TH30_9ACTN|nr:MULTISPECIES: hypothetical protein [Streptomyces]MBQ0949683.1 hypothetical protein [Streptomyces sp. RK76]MDX3320941.1 hypothetical protein [Streptomyces sp. ME03-5684b]MDX3349808.1 hypothetical protein [Streptomyces sp. ME02-6979A]MDX3402077.1 hypothetical protein [Streptomyces sp. ME01-18h]MDX3408764.1 hypothetical protein [Streptomyces sp. ME02-6977A]
MNILKPAALLLAATALAAGSTAAATAADSPGGTRVTDLQQTAGQVLADSPKPLRVTADAVEYEGLTVTDAPVTKGAQDLPCDYGHLCMVVKGTKFDFYKCQTWNLTNWTGDGPFTNNQTRGTVAKFFNKDGSVRWTSTAYQAGTASWDPIWSLRPC